MRSVSRVDPSFLALARAITRKMGPAMVVALLAAACGGGGDGNRGGGSSPTGPSDTTTPTPGVTMTIGPCEAEPGFCGGNQPSFQIFADPRQRDNDPSCATCPFSYTFLNHTISGSGQKSTQFLGIRVGNYEITAQMSGGGLSFRFGGTGGFYSRSIHIIEGPNPIAPCQPNGGAVVRFSQAAGSAPQTVRFIVAVRQGVPECVVG
jgi:hypothetical protein